MARPRAIDGIDPARPYGEAARRIVAVRAAELVEQSSGVLDTRDIERVHDLRVATRRLRAALEAFEPCFPRGPWRSTLKEVKRLANALGERRDRDVAIASLERFGDGVPASERVGVRSLIGELRREQASANEALAPRVAAERIAALEAQLDGLVAAAR